MQLLSISEVHGCSYPVEPAPSVWAEGDTRQDAERWLCFHFPSPTNQGGDIDRGHSGNRHALVPPRFPRSAGLTIVSQRQLDFHPHLLASCRVCCFGLGSLSATSRC